MKNWVTTQVFLEILIVQNVLKASSPGSLIKCRPVDERESWKLPHDAVQGLLQPRVWVPARPLLQIHAPRPDPVPHLQLRHHLQQHLPLQVIQIFVISLLKVDTTYRFLKTQTENNVALKETDQKRNRKRNLVPASLGIIHIFLLGISYIGMQIK